MSEGHADYESRLSDAFGRSVAVWSTDVSCESGQAAVLAAAEAYAQAINSHAGLGQACRDAAAAAAQCGWPPDSSD